MAKKFIIIWNMAFRIHIKSKKKRAVNPWFYRKTLELTALIHESDRRGSNPRSRPWQGRALPTTPLSQKRVMGIEPTCPAWKAGVLPLNYTRTVYRFMWMPSSGIEPETRGFSVLCSTNWANWACCVSATILYYTQFARLSIPFFNFLQLIH